MIRRVIENVSVIFNLFNVVTAKLLNLFYRGVYRVVFVCVCLFGEVLFRVVFFRDRLIAMSLL